MNVLRQAFESLGFSGVATFLGSGNMVFETRATDVETLEKKIERRLERTLGLLVPWTSVLLAARLDFRADVFIVLPASQERTGQRRPGRRSLKIALEQGL